MTLLNLKETILFSTFSGNQMSRKSHGIYTTVKHKVLLSVIYIAPNNLAYNFSPSSKKLRILSHIPRSPFSISDGISVGDIQDTIITHLF